jgi:tetratricopeptide (TPR) repeat protein
MRPYLLLAILALGLSGCNTGILPDPNDPTDVPVVPAEALQNRLKGANEMLQRRFARGEFTEEQYREFIARAAGEILDSVEVEDIGPDHAWRYAEVYLAAQRWREAKDLLEISVKQAKTEDRRVNDSLRLARALAQLGQVRKAIRVARTVFDTPPNEKAPIMMAVLLEIVPAGRGKGQDAELGKLLQDSIQQAKETVVDESTEPGKAFLAARPHHVNNAWRTTIELFEAAGRRDLAQKAGDLALAEMQSRGRI